MKKVLALICIFIFGLYSVGCYQDLRRENLDEYIDLVHRGGGHSSTSLDRAEYFLPSDTFFEDYDYIDGKYAWREDDMFRKRAHPEVAFLCLRYDKEIYINAKQCMLDNIKPYNELYYQYNDYIFYENLNYIKGMGRNFPEDFTMACYNDERYTLIFIGFNARVGSDRTYMDNINNNFVAFINAYYSEYHDFNQ